MPELILRAEEIAEAELEAERLERIRILNMTPVVYLTPR